MADKWKAFPWKVQLWKKRAEDWVAHLFGFQRILWLPHSVLGDIMGVVAGTWERLVLKKQNIVIFTLWLNSMLKALLCLLKTAPQAPNPIQVQDDPKALYGKRDTQREVKGIKSAVSLRTARRQIVSNAGYYCLSRGVK